MNKIKNIIIVVVGIPVALGIFYGAKHLAHVKCVEGALEMYCKNKYADVQQIESVDVPWWNPFGDDKYACTAKLSTLTGNCDIAFDAKKASVSDLMEDDWDVNMGFWGWIGDDYRIINVKVR
jgi:hypothetical protein